MLNKADEDFTIILNEYGFGYPVCEECYKKELEDEKNYRE